MSYLAYTGLAIGTAGAYYFVGKYGRQLWDLYGPHGNGRRS